MAQAQPVKKAPWFAIGNAEGDRTLAQQMLGLSRLFAEVKGRTVLDVGCAEGLLSLEMFKAGATEVRGIEIRPLAVDKARRLVGPGDSAAVRFSVADADTYTPARDYDIVAMLAVLHKLRDPSKACAHLAACAKELVVIRLPPAFAPAIIDARSGRVAHHIDLVMEDVGFMLEHASYDGPFGEWVGYFRRIKP